MENQVKLYKEHEHIWDGPPTKYSDNEYQRITGKLKGMGLGVKNNPIVPDMADVQPWFYYDRITVAANTAPTNSILFFATPMSPTKTKLDTNLKQGGRLPDPKHFIVTNVRFIFMYNMAPADIISMISNYWVEFEIGDKIFAEGHIDLYPGGAGLHGSQATTGVANAWCENGYPSPLAVNDWGLDRGLTILQGQSFAVKLISPAAPTLSASPGTGLNLRCVLDGILTREVQ